MCFFTSPRLSVPITNRNANDATRTRSSVTRDRSNSDPEAQARGSLVIPPIEIGDEPVRMVRSKSVSTVSEAQKQAKRERRLSKLDDDDGHRISSSLSSKGIGSPLATILSDNDESPSGRSFLDLFNDMTSHELDERIRSASTPYAPVSVPPSREKDLTKPLSPRLWAKQPASAQKDEDDESEESIPAKKRLGMHRKQENG